MTNSTTMTQLPPVAFSFTQHCKKCDADRLHKVLAHVDDKSAKIECEICKKKSTFKLQSAKKKATASGAKKKTAKKSTSPLAPSYNDLQEKHAGQAPKKYRITERFDKDSVVEHPKFGIGFILNVSDSRIEASFSEGVKTLVHNQK